MLYLINYAYLYSKIGDLDNYYNNDTLLHIIHINESVFLPIYKISRNKINIIQNVEKNSYAIRYGNRAVFTEIL